MSEFASALYFGTVQHRRLRPRRHRLRYRVFSLLIDLDELPALGRALRLFSYNRPNLFSFYARDHGAGGSDLRAWVDEALGAGGIASGGAIRLLCSPRMLGYVFNPLSVYFCHDRDGRLAAILYEVANTFGERHSYLAPVDALVDGAPGVPIRQRCAKEFYVSPFLPMAMTYHFRVVPPGERLAVAITETDAEGPLLHASLTASRDVLSDRTLLRAFCRYPLLTFKVIAAIHWHALLLWGKGIGIVRRPPPPAHAVTLMAPGRE